MNKKIIASIIIVTIGLGLYFWWFSDSKVIKRHANNIVECFEKDGDAGRIGGVVASTNLKKLLDDNVYFKIENNNIPYASSFRGNIDKDTLIRAHMGLVNSAGIVTITNKQITVSDITDDKANVDLSFHIKSEKLPKNFDNDLSIKLTYIKKEDEWKISEAFVK